MDTQTDVVILVGGLAGLSLALQLWQTLPGIDVTVLEKREHPVPEAANKIGESTVEAASHYFAEVLGLRQHILDRQLPRFGLRFFFPAGDNSRIEQRLELGAKCFAHCPSYQLGRGRFENHLGEVCRGRGVQFIDQANVTSIDIRRRRKQHSVGYRFNDDEKQVTARSVVDASGRRALLYAASWTAEARDTHRECRMASNRTADQDRRLVRRSGVARGHSGNVGRWYSTNHLKGEGYWVWLIPLAPGSTSVGTVAAEQFHALSEFNSLSKAVAWLERHETQCATAVKANLGNVQDFCVIKHYSTECQQLFSTHRWGITGEVGFFHDPFYSPGSEFIAFVNTFLTDPITRDVNGRGFRIRDSRTTVSSGGSTTAPRSHIRISTACSANRRSRRLRSCGTTSFTGRSLCSSPCRTSSASGTQRLASIHWLEGLTSRGSPSSPKQTVGLCQPWTTAYF